MVLFTLLGLTAYFLQKRKKANNTDSGQSENLDQSDEVPPVESWPDDGQTSRNITSDHEVLPTAEEPITGDPEVNNEWSQDPSLEETITGNPPIDEDWRHDSSLEEPITGDPPINDDWHHGPSLEEPITGDPPINDDWHHGPSLEEPITGDPPIDDDWHHGPSLEEPITGDSQITDDWSDDVFQDLVGDLSEWRADILQALNTVMCKLNDDSFQTPAHVAPDTSDDVAKASDRLAEDTVASQLSQQQDNERTIMKINSCCYEIGDQLGKGGYGTVYAATRLEDDRQVAVKFASNEYAKYARIDGYSRPIPLEVALQMYANQGPRVPQIIELLDWKDEDDRYIMVLERPVPCQLLRDFLQSYTSTMDEKLARIIMGDVAFAAQTCCQRGVLHRDIKLENLLINPDTLEVKLIDFGCGDFLTSAGYTSFAGTDEFCPPEYEIDGLYHGEPATVWSLGILLFLILFWKFPSRRDLRMISKNVWENYGLSQECSDFICGCLQRNPSERIELEKICLHNWFNDKGGKENNVIQMTGSSAMTMTEI